MTVLDVDQLIAPIDDEAPSGPDLEYEPEFGELERAALGKPEHVMGDQVVEAEPPEWREVFTLAQDLFGRSKDLRIGVNLARAATNLHGPEGLADGLSLMASLLEQYWDTVHPQLDPDDDYDPMLRLNTVLPLNDREGLRGDLLEMMLVESRQVGRFRFRDVKIASGAMKASGDDAGPDSALISAAFLDCDVDALQADAEFINSALECVGRIDKAISDQVGAANAPDFSGLESDLKELQVLYAENLNARGIGVEMPEGAEGAAGPAAAGGGAPISGEVNSREDVNRMIDKICLYYERHEPSSPVPMLLRRAKRLVPLSYLEIMRDLTPDGVTQAELMGGIKPEDEY